MYQEPALGRGRRVTLMGEISDALFLTNDISEAASVIRLRDRMLSSFSETTTWEYDIASRTMTINYIHEGVHDKTAVVENYKETIHEMQLIQTEDLPVFARFCQELDEGRTHIFAEFRGLTGKYEYKWFRYFGDGIEDEITGKITKIAGHRYDITREKNLKDDMEKRLTQDLLTGLNHRDRARELIENEQKVISGESAYLLIDVDAFRSINNSYGKMYGDVVLQTLSGIIYTNFMSKDIIGRIAGDQFIVYCNEINSAKIRELTEKLMQRIMENVPLRDQRCVTISVGIAYSPKDGSEFQELYNKADIALSKAKALGGNRYVEYDGSSMCDIKEGYTFKKIGAFAEDEERTGKAARKINKRLFDFAFDELTREDDFERAIKDIFKEVCLHYNLDRAILLGIDSSGRSIDMATRWCRIDDKNDLDILRTSIVSAWDEFEAAARKSKEQYFVMNSGRGGGMDFFREVLTMNKVPVSALMLPVRDNDGLLCLLFFDAFEEHEFRNNEIATIRSIVRLITSYLISRQVKQELETESIINKNVMDAQKIIYYVIDGNTHEIKYVSKYARDFFDKFEYGKKCFSSFYGKSDVCDICPINSESGGGKTIEVYDEEKDRWYTYTATKMADPRYENDILICITDVTDFLHRVKGEDTLTQIGSYDNFMLLATKAITNKEQEYTLLFLGIRNFAKINDEYGYVTGDDILKSFARVLSDDTGDGELLCRIKGDDFAMLLKRTSEAELRRRIKNYSERLTAEFKKAYPAIEINCFAGSYDIPFEEQYFNRCIDKSMRARRVAFDDIQTNEGFYAYTRELEQYEQERDEMDRKMRYALTHEGFKVYLQPKVDVNSGEIIGAEALVRMQDAEGKMVPPGLFIPLAEKTGMVVDIDRSVYEQTFYYMSKWKKEGKKVPLISVNVSRLHLIDDKLPERMKALAEKYELDPKEIELEITESVFFEDTERLINMIKRLKDIGFVISMDDFGAGYSTLNFMKSLPVDVIKIDGGFFMRNEMDRKNKAVISAILQLSKNLEFETVSEGVETEEQVKFIREQGGKCVQGYYFYKPMPADEFEKLLG